MATDKPRFQIVVQEVYKQHHFCKLYTFPSLVQRRQLAQDQADFRLAALDIAIETLQAVYDGKLIAAPGMEAQLAHLGIPSLGGAP
jgi:hypothetical protein